MENPFTQLLLREGIRKNLGVNEVSTEKMASLLNKLRGIRQDALGVVDQIDLAMKEPANPNDQNPSTGAKFLPTLKNIAQEFRKVAEELENLS